MKMFSLMAAAVGVGLAAMFSKSAEAAPVPSPGPAISIDPFSNPRPVSTGPAPGAGRFDYLYQQYGALYGVDWRLVKAHAIVESSENPRAFNPEKARADDGSYGLMQLYAVVNGQGRITNKLNVDGWPPENVDALFDPGTNVAIAVQIMASNIRVYGMPRAIAVYNAWGQHLAPRAGPFKNQSYVDKVLKAAARLGLVL